MRLSGYQSIAKTTARDKSAPDELYHLLLGLSGEVGEIMEKAKKEIRDNNSKFDANFRLGLYHELGDVLWYVAMLAEYFDFSLDYVADRNIEKLQSRQARGVLSGSGDNR